MQQFAGLYMPGGQTRLHQPQPGWIRGEIGGTHSGENNAIEGAGLRPGEDVAISLDIAASEFGRDGRYRLALDGNELDRDNGRVFPTHAVFDGLRERYRDFTCYVVEVCTGCNWNHLVRSIRFENTGGN